MKKLLTLILTISLPVFSTFAQKVLSVRDITPELSVYPCGDRHEALVVFRCSEDFALEFSSNVDKSLEVETMTEGTEVIYNIILPTRAEGSSYRGRQLTVIAPGFNKFYLALDLKDKEKLEFLVSDPYSSLRSLYYTSLDEGCKLMQEGAFMEAVDKFNIAKSCPEFSEVQNNIDQYITACDSSQVWQTEMKRYEKVGKYDSALKYCRMILTAIPSCKYAVTEHQILQRKFNEMCSFDRDVAEKYISNGKLSEARDLLQHSIDIGSPYSAEAAILIQDINKKLYKSDNHTRSLSYQYAIGRPIGLFTSSLKPKGVGAYFSIGINKEIIDLLSSKLQPIAPPDRFTYEAGASVGLSIPVVPKYLWVLVSPFSYIGGGYLANEGTDYWSNVKWYSGIAPEVGLSGKIWRIVLSYRFQYKYCLSKEEGVSDMMGKTGHLFTIGFCW